MARRRYWKLSTGKEAYNILIMPLNKVSSIMMKDFVTKYPFMLQHPRVSDWIQNALDRGHYEQ